MPSVASRIPLLLPWLAALLLACLAGPAAAQDAADPPGRVAFVSDRQGSVVFAPQGEEEWTELPKNRPLVEGDRLWTDAGARAELQLGTATLHVNSETQVGISDLDQRAAQFMIQQGTVNVRVREVAAGENVEVDTPNLAFRALQPGNFRIDVAPQGQQTRVVVHSGTAVIYGEGGENIHLGAGQQATFAGRYLAQVASPAFIPDDFARWSFERNAAEDQAIATRYVPRGVVGATELDRYGTWNQDPNYGTVWYPTVTVANWAPYRYGHWSWIAPWGWTWIDDAPWGFAPFHYGRWTMIGPRWAWVPGPLPARPVYSPALVVFLGGGAELAVGAGPAVGWYPLAPGEAWWPWYRASTRYVASANYRYNLNAWPRGATNHQWRQRPFAVTTVREDDFRRGRPVERSWQPAQPRLIERAQPNVVPPRPQRGWRDSEAAPRLHNAPPAAVQPAVSPRNWTQHDAVPPLVREQREAQREQDHLQRDAERDARQQMREQYEERRNAQRNAGRAGADPNGVFGRPAPQQPQGQPRFLQQRHEQPVPVPRRETIPVLREERVRPHAQPQRQQEHHEHQHPQAEQRGDRGWNR